MSCIVLDPYYLYPEDEEEEHPTIEGFHFAEEICSTNSSNNILYLGADRNFYVAKFFKGGSNSFEKEVHLLEHFQENKEVVDLKSYDQNQNIIITEFCQLGDLNNFLKEIGSISPSLFIKIFNGLLKAVYTLHKENFSHGDIKLENFFVRDYDSTTQDIQIVIGDFGSARDLHNEEARSAFFASDIFSLGKVMKSIYKKVTGCIPLNIYLMMDKMMEQNAEMRPSIQDIIDELKMN